MSRALDTFVLKEKALDGRATGEANLLLLVLAGSITTRFGNYDLKLHTYVMVLDNRDLYVVVTQKPIDKAYIEEQAKNGTLNISRINHFKATLKEIDFEDETVNETPADLIEIGRRYAAAINKKMGY